MVRPALRRHAGIDIRHVHLKQFMTLITKRPAGPFVDVKETAVLTDEVGGFMHVIERSGSEGQPFPGPAAFCDIAERNDGPGDFPRFHDWRTDDIHRKTAAVLTPV